MNNQELKKEWMKKLREEWYEVSEYEEMSRKDEVFAWFIEHFDTRLKQFAEEVEKEINNEEEMADFSVSPWPRETQIEVDGWNAAIKRIKEILSILKERYEI